MCAHVHSSHPQVSFVAPLGMNHLLHKEASNELVSWEWVPGQGMAGGGPATLPQEETSPPTWGPFLLLVNLRPMHGKSAQEHGEGTFS